MLLRCWRLVRARRFHFVNEVRCYSNLGGRTRPGQLSVEFSKVNQQLAAMIKDRAEEAHIYKFVISNVKTVESELVEVFLFNLMAKKNLSATTALLHCLFDSTQFILSNELWSHYTSEVCNTAHHLGALLIYHHLIENYILHEHHRSTFIVDNNYIPFLLSPCLLQHLAIIFQQNKDPQRCKGILSYFKRFYSYLSYKTYYKSLQISIVEAYSSSNDFPSALSMFNRLAGSMRGHFNNKQNWTRMNSLLKRAAFFNYVQRKKNVKENLKLDMEYPNTMLSELDELQLSQYDNLFDPLIERNIYTSSEIHGIPLVNGSLLISDLPQFSNIILLHVNTTMAKYKEISSIIPFIKSNHSSIHIFVTKALCELGYIEEAFQILKKLPYEYPIENARVLIPDDNFYWIMYYIKKACHSKIHNHNYQKLINEIALFYDSLQKSDKLSPKFYSEIISTVLCLPTVKQSDVLIQLKKLKSADKIILSKHEYRKISGLLEGVDDYFCTLGYK
jgi:hypothetical protein